ncbi:hypothetical protein ACFY00_15695 [Kitasatospora sp. NPDC001540]|uniref:hypothetical protein n=1 Tax=Kitasatospora sp. NPDC001540 TaxID=3364014 RepID=UPI0036B39C26
MDWQYDGWRTVYGSAPRRRPAPDGVYLELHGGPFDGQLLDVAGWTPDELAGGARLVIPGDRTGPRANYESDPDDPFRWHYRGNIHC